jgi:hypothetical protein
MGIALYDAARNPAWVKYSRLEEDTNAREILSEVSEVTQAVVVSMHGAISIPDMVRIIGDAQTYGFYREILDSMATKGKKANVRSLESFGDDDRMSWGDCTF